MARNRSIQARLTSGSLRAHAHPGALRLSRAGCAGYIEAELAKLGLASRGDRLGNLIATLDGDCRTDRDAVRPHGPARPHRAQDRGGRPHPGRAPRRRAGEGAAGAGGAALRRRGPRRAGRHRQQEPSRDDARGESTASCPIAELYVDARFRERRRGAARPASISARRSSTRHAPSNLPAAASPAPPVDDRAGCAVHASKWRARLKRGRHLPTVHLVFSVQEEFNLRGAVTAAQALMPDIAIQLDLMLATDTPDMASRGDVRLGGGPAMSLYSFHGRGTLNGTHPASGTGAACSKRRRRARDFRCSAAPISGALTDFVLCAARRRRGRVHRSRLSLPLHPFRAAKSAISPISSAWPGSLRRRPRRGSTAASASTATTTSDEALSRHRYRHLRIEGRARRRIGHASSHPPRARTG